jgi:putative alpha-1,2-mannosidase
MRTVQGNLAAEMTGWDFDGPPLQPARHGRNVSAFSAEAADSALLRVFYTALYHTMIAPNLYT